MKTTRPGAARYPKLYQVFSSSQEIADTINRSPSYVKKALKQGFTKREMEMIEKAKNRTDLFEERIA
ncbi:MAG: hypothetical protein J6S14_22365 [Clostridia bacterium]|nr:hypothetical protein [Clostridia bacterium]